MTFQDLKRRHPGRVCICRPHLRDSGNGQVVSWICLRTFADVDTARETLERFEERDGVTDAVLISTTNRIPIEGDMAARYSRIFLGMEP